MTAALITVTLLGIGGLGYSAIIGFMANVPSDVGQHATIAIFFTLINAAIYRAIFLSVDAIIPLL